MIKKSQALKTMLPNMIDSANELRDRELVRQLVNSCIDDNQMALIGDAEKNARHCSDGLIEGGENEYWHIFYVSLSDAIANEARLCEEFEAAYKRDRDAAARAAELITLGITYPIAREYVRLETEEFQAASCNIDPPEFQRDYYQFLSSVLGRKVNKKTLVRRDILEQFVSDINNRADIDYRSGDYMPGDPIYKGGQLMSELSEKLFQHLQLEDDVNAAARAAVEAIETEADDLEFLDSLTEELNP